MRRYLIFSGIALLVLLVLGWAVSIYRTNQEKSFSPEDHLSFEQGDLKIKVFYNRPIKKGREFWRTGPV
jgi:hypothetical protein